MFPITIKDAIDRLDSFKPNKYTQAEKIQWLSELDSRIKLEIWDTHEGKDGFTFSGYSANTPIAATPLLVNEPYGIMYLHWMEAKVDYHNRDFAAYNNTITLFNKAYEDYANYYNRKNKPKGAKLDILT